MFGISRIKLSLCVPRTLFRRLIVLSRFVLLANALSKERSRLRSSVVVNQGGRSSASQCLWTRTYCLVWG